MTNPWLITVLGMGTVFSALILISLTLTLFPVLFGQKPRQSGSGAGKTVSGNPLPAQQAASSLESGAVPSGMAIGDAGHSNELVAVITAAVVAARGPGAGAFRIVSVSSSAVSGGFNTPAWGHIDRLVR